MMPVEAASTTPMATTEMASPPGAGPSSPRIAFSRRSATPERSSMKPMKMNIDMGISE